MLKKETFRGKILAFLTAGTTRALERRGVLRPTIHTFHRQRT